MLVNITLLTSAPLLITALDPIEVAKLLDQDAPIVGWQDGIIPQGPVGC